MICPSDQEDDDAILNVTKSIAKLKIPCESISKAEESDEKVSDE